MRILICCLVVSALAWGQSDDHEILLTAAATDPIQVVPALIGGSAMLPGLDGPAAVALADRLEPLAQRLFRSDERLPGDQRLALHEHTVASGEFPSRIMQRYAISDAALKLLNPDYDDRRLGLGQRLKVLDLAAIDLVVLVQKSSYRCWILGRFPEVEHLVLIAAFPVGVGAVHSPTPSGNSRIRLKALDPEWTNPENGEVIPPHDPRNVLGGYWMAIDPGPDGRFKSIGFHGYTGAPSADWLGRQDSQGCLRMLQPDIHALYALVPTGTKVVVKD